MIHSHRFITKLLLIAAITALAVVVWVIFPKRSEQSTPGITVTSEVAPAATRVLENSNRSSPTEILAAAESVRRNRSPEDSVRELARLRNYLDGLGSEAASLAVRKHLDSGDDAPTHLEFKLASDGQLKGAPSLRLFLLDCLIQIDPKAAAGYAEKLLRSSNSPDEWAISLRASGLGNTSK